MHTEMPATRASRPLLYYDLGSPYAYLAVTRAAGVLGREPVLEPVLLGGIFALRGHGSWSQTPARAQRIAELRERAARYGLPPMRWPEGWPNNTLKAMRACIWAGELGMGDAFAHAAFAAAFAAGRDLSELEVLRQTAEAVGLPGEELEAAIGGESVKSALKSATAAAWERGVIGVPCIVLGGEVLYGDERLEDAARLLAADD
jgi:2-hydroxychromene-2-carboxylate isomerase